MALLGACGGETGSDGGGGTGGTTASGGGTGGGTAGSGGSGGASGCGPMPGAMDCMTCTGELIGPECKDGSWSCPPQGCVDAGPCGPLPGAMDCEGCSGFTSPVCENGSWTCPPLNCPDAGPDAATCGAGHVPTIDGCLSCAQASTKLGQLIEAARAKNASCSAETDCVMTGSATACNGSCGVAVSKAGEAAFQAALTKIDTGYCAGFVPVCGYSTPKCAMPTLVCNAGQCEAKY